MIKLISHRGNIKGPNFEKENRPSYIDSAIQLGYDVEVDIRFSNGSIWLGHDFPQYKINDNWIINRSDQIWFHCKDLESYKFLKRINVNLKYFFHKNDDFVLTSTNHVWVHTVSDQIDENCIIPLIDENSILNFKKGKVYGICTDFIDLVKEKIKQ